MLFALAPICGEYARTLEALEETLRELDLWAPSPMPWPEGPLNDDESDIGFEVSLRHYTRLLYWYSIACVDRVRTNQKKKGLESNGNSDCKFNSGFDFDRIKERPGGLVDDVLAL